MSNRNEVQILRKMIEEQNALGAKMPTDLENEHYVWNEEGLLTELHLEHRKLRGTLSVSGFACLELLNCSGNELDVLRVSGNSRLKYLFCRNNRLTELAINDSPALKQIDCINNQLTKLDTKSCPMLIELACQDNQLTGLDMSFITRAWK